MPLASLAGKKDVVAKGMIKPGKMKKAYSQQVYGAFFAEGRRQDQPAEVPEEAPPTSHSNRRQKPFKRRSNSKAAVLGLEGSKRCRVGVVDRTFT